MYRNLVIGNGPSAINSPITNLIDLYENVVRINSFKLTCPSLGTRTTTWATARNYGNYKSFLKNPGKIKSILFTNFQSSWRLPYIKDISRETGIPIVFIPELLIRYLNELCTKLHEGPAPEKGIVSSTGLRVLAYYIEYRCEYVECIGMDNFVPGQLMHYHGNRMSQPMMAHSHSAEKKIIDAWITLGKMERHKIIQPGEENKSPVPMPKRRRSAKKERRPRRLKTFEKK